MNKPGMITLHSKAARLLAVEVVLVGRGRWLTTFSAVHNGLLLTERCDNYCLMCSQPPKDRDDSWLFDRARKVIGLLPPVA